MQLFHNHYRAPLVPIRFYAPIARFFGENFEHYVSIEDESYYKINIQKTPVGSGLFLDSFSFIVAVGNHQLRHDLHLGV